MQMRNSAIPTPRRRRAKGMARQTQQAEAGQRHKRHKPERKTTAHCATALSLTMREHWDLNAEDGQAADTPRKYHVSERQMDNTGRTLILPVASVSISTPPMIT